MYHSPALLSAVLPGVVCTIAWQDSGEELCLEELWATSAAAPPRAATIARRHQLRLAFSELPALKARLAKDYTEFLLAESSTINNTAIASSPKLTSFELVAYHIAAMLEQWPQLRRGTSLTVTWQWQLRPGCGMGGSAALLWSITRGLVGDSPWCWKDYFAAVLASENLQHGHSSGLDLVAQALGNTSIYYPVAQTSLARDALAAWQPVPIDFQPPFKVQLVFSGTPLSHTGACVSAVKARLAAQPGLLDEGKASIVAAVAAAKAQDYAAFLEALKANEAWLEAINVVPAKVQRFKQAAAKLGGIVKLTGAGAVSGDGGGMLWLLSPLGDAINWEPLLHEFNYTLEPIDFHTQGVQLVAS